MDPLEKFYYLQFNFLLPGISPFPHFAISSFRHFTISCFKHALPMMLGTQQPLAMNVIRLPFKMLKTTTGYFTVQKGLKVNLV